MDPHFRAFSFVDRLLHLDPGRSARGTYAIPLGLPEFPRALVAEAAGQLAAWAAMSAVDFRLRPVAGLAGRIELLAAVRPGQQLELNAVIDSLDEKAIGYHGSARVDGQTVLRLGGCVGPMLATEEFDDPQALRGRQAVLLENGVAPGAFGGLPRLQLHDLQRAGERSARARFEVPTEAPLFGDHVPRRAVFPGTLLMQLKLELADHLASVLPPEGAAGPWRVREVHDVKLRSFIAPGQSLELEAEWVEDAANRPMARVISRQGSRRLGAAKALLGAEVAP